MSQILSILFFIACIIEVPAQNDSSQSIDAAGIKEVVIVTDEVFKINIRSYQGNKIFLTTHSEGEYYNDIHLDIERSQQKLRVNSRYREILQGGYDKLSAHKVFSMEISLQVPHGLDVYVRSNLAAVSASGNFKNFKAELEEGFCELENFTGNAVVNTYRGNITVTTSNARIKASTGRGKLILQDIPEGNYTIELRSVTGDIKVGEN